MTQSVLQKAAGVLTTILLSLLLITIILCSTANSLHSRLLSMGESLWPGYSELRQDAIAPDCTINDAANAEPPGVVELPGDGEEDALDLDALLGEEEEDVSDEAVAAANAICQGKLDKYNALIEKQNNPSLQRFVTIEKDLVGGKLNKLGENEKQFLILIFILCGITVTLNRQHLGLRSPQTKLEDECSQIVQLIGNVILICGFALYYPLHRNDADGELAIYWIVGFGLMALCNILLLLFPLAPKEKKKSGIGSVLLGIPLYAYMAVIGGVYFLMTNNFSGIASRVSSMTDHASLYTNVALYVFCGMLLKYTDIADKFFAILRPWKLSPELLAFFIVVLAAYPTAYSGASGIFVLAAGALIYREMKQAGSRDSLALAATAMSGSMGIVLSPCLLVVIIAALNNGITTDELFKSGKWVFGVNIAILGLALLATHQGKLRCANPIKAIPKSLMALVGVLPYALIGAAVLACFHYGLNKKFDEFCAAWMLPFMLLVLLIYDRCMAKYKYKKLAFAAGHNVSCDVESQGAEPEKKSAESEESKAESEEKSDESETDEASDDVETEKLPKQKPDGILASLFKAVNSTSVASGGLLTLMTLSICLGSIIEDSAVISMIMPDAFSSKFLAMGILVIILVLIGMVMDPYGAVILVSATLVNIATQSGIDLRHFWLTVLCAFELGYLTPPVALNQLLTRQVVGDKAFAYEQSADRSKKFWYRHERLMLPLAVKGVVLLLVAFLPLVINWLHWFGKS